jgi:tetratricopeptide (TPR) repeat protein
MVPSYPITFWLTDVYPHLKASHKPNECIQQPGDILYIPEGWYHAVLNLDDVVAVTFQNLSYATGFHQLITPNAHVAERERARQSGMPWGRQSERLDLPFFIGASLLHSHNVSGAMAELRHVVERDPNIAMGWTLLGEANARLGELDEANSYYQRAIAINPAAIRPRKLYKQFLSTNPAFDTTDGGFQVRPASWHTCIIPTCM